mmetsp:Transcript_15818/g.25242  ORF Transcript_15818/g.25242 Transcript_15818/m.25242 type:complete len:264 (-) Transcript_15818:411-1202(-)
MLPSCTLESVRPKLTENVLIGNKSVIAMLMSERTESPREIAVTRLLSSCSQSEAKRRCRSETDDVAPRYEPATTSKPVLCLAMWSSIPMASPGMSSRHDSDKLLLDSRFEPVSLNNRRHGLSFLVSRRLSRTDLTKLTNQVYGPQMGQSRMLMTFILVLSSMLATRYGSEMLIEPPTASTLYDKQKSEPVSSRTLYTAPSTSINFLPRLPDLLLSFEGLFASSFNVLKQNFELLVTRVVGRSNVATTVRPPAWKSRGKASFNG